MYGGQVLYQNYPYAGLPHLIENGHVGLDKPRTMSDGLWAILLKCWAVAPSARLSIEEFETMFSNSFPS